MCSKYKVLSVKINQYVVLNRICFVKTTVILTVVLLLFLLLIETALKIVLTAFHPIVITIVLTKVQL